MSRISVIVPVLNDADQLTEVLAPLQPLRGSDIEIIVVDGGSSDNSYNVAESLADCVLSCEKGRARQMNFGAQSATSPSLLFLHADTHLPAPLKQTLDLLSQHPWGRFDVRLTGQHWLYSIISRSMNLRSCLTGIATGDQAIFVERKLFNQVDGFPEIPIMEDIALSRKLRKRHRPQCLRPQVNVSTRYWQKNGIINSMIKMWLLRLAYFLGVPPRHLVKIYYGKNS